MRRRPDGCQTWHRARISIQTSSHEAAVAAAVHGAGLVCLARFRADREPGLMRLMPPVRIPSAGMWLVVHRDNRQTPRIRVVLTLITENARAIRHLLEPDDVQSIAEQDPTLSD